MEQKHIPALDGVRGIAILLVMLFHLQLPGLSLGWSGVPLFFVLSGFLITGILLQKKIKHPLPSYLGNFMTGRSLRIFPLFFLYLAVNALLRWATGKPLDGYGWYLVYLQNYSIGLDPTNTPGILGHTWSLAVEEQFYLLWPLVVYGLPRRWLAGLCVVLVVTGPVWRHVLYAATSNVYLTNTSLSSCIDLLAYGSLLAILRQTRPLSRMPLLLAGLGAVMTGLAVWQSGAAAFWLPQDWVPFHPTLLTALALALGSLVWCAAQGCSQTLNALLSARWLRFTGRISYGLYIWHLLCFVLVEKMFSKLNHALLLQPVMALALAYGVAMLSYRWFESPFLKLKQKLETTRPAVHRQAGGISAHTSTD